MPNGAFGTWMTKRLKVALGGMPCTLTSMISTGPVGVIFTSALASGRQVFAPLETTMSKAVECLEFGAAISGDAVSNSPIPAAPASKKCNLLTILVSPLRGFQKPALTPQTRESIADASRRPLVYHRIILRSQAGLRARRLVTAFEIFSRRCRTSPRGPTSAEHNYWMLCCY